jgi:hypothetical protein
MDFARSLPPPPQRTSPHQRTLAHALVPPAEIEGLPWAPASGASFAYLDRAIVDLGSAANAAPLLDGLGGNLTVLAIGSSVTGNSGGCTHGLAPSCRGRCGGNCGASRGMRGDGWLRIFYDGISDGRSGRLLNSGKSGGSMVHFAECAGSYLPAELQLVVIELAVSRFE